MWIGVIAQLDFSAYYASIVIAYFVSAENRVNCESGAPNTVRLDATTDGHLKECGTMVRLMQKWMHERATAKQAMSEITADRQLTKGQRRPLIAKQDTLQRAAKDRMNSLIGIWACKRAGPMTDLQQANVIYNQAKHCLQSVIDLISTEFATCNTCGSTHHFGQRGRVGAFESCDQPSRGAAIEPIETVTDSVVFAMSPNDPECYASEMTETIQSMCFAQLSPIKIVLEKLYSIWMYPDGQTTFALPLKDSDASLPENWLNKGPILNPAKGSIYKLHIYRGVFATIACYILQNFPRTARVAEQMVITALKRSDFSLTDFRAVMMSTTRICPAAIQQDVCKIFEPHCK